jgi:hypothetical protein
LLGNQRADDIGAKLQRPPISAAGCPATAAGIPDTPAGLRVAMYGGT